jgi:hypothetical protein
MKISQEFEGKTFPENFSAEIKFLKMDAWWWWCSGLR